MRKVFNLFEMKNSFFSINNYKVGIGIAFCCFRIQEEMLPRTTRGLCRGLCRGLPADYPRTMPQTMPRYLRTILRTTRGFMHAATQTPILLELFWPLPGPHIEAPMLSNHVRLRQ